MQEPKSSNPIRIVHPVVLMMLGVLFDSIMTSVLYASFTMGLTIIFGMLGIINFSHGALYALGAYLAFSLVGVNPVFPLATAIAIAPMIIVLLGFAMERSTIAPIQRAPPSTHFLLTFGWALFLTGLIRVVWGPGMKVIPLEMYAGEISILGEQYPLYRLIVILVGSAFLALTYYVFEQRMLGKIVRATSIDRAMVESLGINTSRYFAIVFAVGCGLAAFAGALVAPLYRVNPDIGDSVVITSFIIAIVGGLGSILGALLASFVVGTSVTIANYYAPDVAPFFPLLLMVIVLLFRPGGLLGESKDI